MEQNGKVCYADDSPEFFKIYTDQLCSLELKIPPAFVKKFNGDLPQMYTLEGPQGRSWEILVSKHGEYFYFEEGWQNFVEDNSLEHGDFLTFCYGGGSRFYVKIFGKHGCRKEVALNAVDQLPGGKWNNTKPTRRSLRSRTRGSGSEINPAGIVQDNLSRNSDPFRVKLTTTYANKFAKFPLHFENVEKHWKSGKCASLRVQGREWKVSIAKSGRYFHLSKGWSSFVKENSLREGDECNFEIIDDNDDGFVFEVTTSKFQDKNRS